MELQVNLIFLSLEMYHLIRGVRVSLDTTDFTALQTMIYL